MSIYYLTIQTASKTLLRRLRIKVKKNESIKESLVDMNTYLICPYNYFEVKEIVRYLIIHSTHNKKVLWRGENHSYLR